MSLMFLLRGVLLLGGSFYLLWLWWAERNPYELSLAVICFLGAVYWLLDWLLMRVDDEDQDVRRPGTDDPAKGLDGMGWGKQKRR